MKQAIPILLLALLGSSGCETRNGRELSAGDVTGVYQNTWCSSDRERSLTYEERATLSPSGSISFHFTLRCEDFEYETNKSGTYRLDGDAVISDVVFDWRDGVKWCERPDQNYYQASSDLTNAYVTGEALVFRQAEGGKALELNGRRLLLQSQGALASR